ncbi:calcium-dependent protein kinase 3-like [Hydractinia symbiolongicarpus]|uniref:calcium-dependent protein kinase 3-like n=1 Tax=Hydractinia symbiolongicarpus TaxID=13093 RepID=UPI00254CDCBF|nr:calcium-dependent protein kinase 3-like [Hydractinia symbiolongicarpus]
MIKSIKEHIKKEIMDELNLESLGIEDQPSSPFNTLAIVSSDTSIKVEYAFTENFKIKNQQDIVSVKEKEECNDIVFKKVASPYHQKLAESFKSYLISGEKDKVKRIDTVTFIKTKEFMLWPRNGSVHHSKSSSQNLLTKIYLGYQHGLGWVAVKQCLKQEKVTNIIEENFCWPYTFQNILYFTNVNKEHDEDFNYLAMELCDETLAEYIKKNLEERKKVEMAITLLRAIEYLHSKGIVHRDIKPSNILFVNKTLKVADFGISRQINPDATYRTTNAGTLDYQAPDLIGEEGNVRVEFKHDVYSVLVIMFYIFTDGEHPFHFDVDRCLKNKERKKRIKGLDFRYEKPINKKIENQLKQFLLRHVASLVKNGEAVTLKEIISFFQKHTKTNPYCTTLMKESTSAVSCKRYAILLSFTTETEQKKHFLETEKNVKERKFDEATLNVVFRESVAEGALSSPVADVTLMRNALERCGFDASRTKDDASVNDLKAMIEDIAEGNQNQTICIFLHISGHGFHCKENDDTFIIFKESEFFAVNQIIRMIITTIGDNNQIIFTIDACRKISSIDRQELDKINLPRNVCILYSCEKGKDTADAGMSASIKSKLCDGANTAPAIFSRAVSDNITCGVSVDYLFERVKSIMVTEDSCIDTPEKQGHVDFVF